MKIVSSMIALFMTVTSALASGKIDESGSYFCEGEGSYGSGWVWSEATKVCFRAPISQFIGWGISPATLITFKTALASLCTLAVQFIVCGSWVVWF